MAARGCGATRTPAGIYACHGLSPGGMPLEHFLIDPPEVLDFAAMGITPRGTHLIQSDSGVWHIVDWIGSKHYLNVADYVEEVRRMGASRRLSPKLDFSRLTADSQMFLVHSRAWEENIAAYETWVCPKDLAHHRPGAHGEEPFCCAGVWWENVEGGEYFGNRNGRDVVKREMPSFSYFARRRPAGVEPSYKPALFMRLPIHNLQVIKSEDGRHKAAEEAARKAQIEVRLEDE